MKPNPRLTLETLEARDVPAVFGNPWQQAASLTMSFAADGVQYSNQTWGQTSFSSGLFAELNSTMTTSVWQEEILRAFHTWTSQANINVGLVADSGLAFGGFSTTVKSATFRLGSVSNATDVLATSMPNHPLTGAYAGTMMLNDAFTFSKGGATGTYDLYTVALHEFSNLLGLADDDVTAGSARNGSYTGVRTGLVSADVATLQAMYGARAADTFEGSGGNNTRAAASVLSHVSDPAATGKKRVVANGDITTGADADYYRFSLPDGASSITIRLGTAGKSLLAGQVQVYDGDGDLIATKTNTTPLQGDTVLTLTGLDDDETYYVKVSAGRTDTFNTGKYQLRVGFAYDPVTETAAANPVQQFGSDGNTNETRQTATTLTATAGYVAGTHFEWTGRIESLADLDYYKITAPTGGGVMTINVQSEGSLSTSATVYDSAGNVVASNILINWEGGMYRAQVPNTTAGATYYVRLKVQDANWSAWSGNYAASIDFRQPLATTQALASGTADRNSQIAFGIDVQESGTFRFSLSATSTNTSAVNWLEYYIYDATGNLVAMCGTDGLSSTDTLAVFLGKGQYTIQVKAYYNTTNSTATINYDLKLSRLSDPIDPYAPPDPTSPPPPASPPPPPPPAPPPGDGTGVIIIPPPYTPPWTP